MIDITVLATALAMDAFAVSIALGSKKPQDIAKMALKVGIFFGAFQAFMPLIGFLAGVGLDSYISSVDHWIAFVLLSIIGLKMIYEAFSNDEEIVCATTNRMLLTLAIATSIDAMAAGFAINLFSTSILVSIAIIGIITFLFSFIGVYIGSKGGEFLESKAEFIGGIILIGIGAKILYEHTIMIA